MSGPRTKDPFGILTDQQWDDLHADLRKMAEQRRRTEAESAFIVIGASHNAQPSDTTEAHHFDGSAPR